MVYFMEIDEDGRILGSFADPNITIVPLLNRLCCLDSNRQPIRDSNGNLMTGDGRRLLAPIEISAEDFALVVNGGYHYDFAQQKVVPNA